MRLILILDRCIQKIIRTYRKQVFRALTGCPHKEFSVVGKVNVINRNIKVGRNVTIYPDVSFTGDGLIDIGDNVSIGQGTILYASKSGGGIFIGDNSQIAAQCYIIDMDHGMGRDKCIREQENSVEKIIIGSDVWIAAGCKILKGSYIGQGAVIGALGLVKGEVNPYTIAVGQPVREIRERK